MFKVGDEVTWTSQAGGHAKTKNGVVAEVVAAGKEPDRDAFPALYKWSGVGCCRSHESYVVMVGKKPYWPLASKLRQSR